MLACRCVLSDAGRPDRGRITGRVVSQDGNPVVNLKVTARQAGAGIRALTSPWAMTDAHGRFAIYQLLLGTYQVYTEKKSEYYRTRCSQVSIAIARLQPQRLRPITCLPKSTFNWVLRGRSLWGQSRRRDGRSSHRRRNPLAPRKQEGRDDRNHLVAKIRDTDSVKSRC